MMGLAVLLVFVNSVWHFPSSRERSVTHKLYAGFCGFELTGVLWHLESRGRDKRGERNLCVMATIGGLCTEIVWLRSVWCVCLMRRVGY